VSGRANAAVLARHCGYLLTGFISAKGRCNARWRCRNTVLGSICTRRPSRPRYQNTIHRRSHTGDTFESRMDSQYANKEPRRGGVGRWSAGGMCMQLDPSMGQGVLMLGPTRLSAHVAVATLYTAFCSSPSLGVSDLRKQNRPSQGTGRMLAIVSGIFDTRYLPVEGGGCS
jgi:hypothetical protein